MIRLAIVISDFHFLANRMNRATALKLQIADMFASLRAVSPMDCLFFLTRLCYFAIENGDPEFVSEILHKLESFYGLSKVKKGKENFLLSVICLVMVVCRLVLGLPIGTFQLFKMAENCQKSPVWQAYASVLGLKQKIK